MMYVFFHSHLTYKTAIASGGIARKSLPLITLSSKKLITANMNRYTRSTKMLIKLKPLNNPLKISNPVMFVNEDLFTDFSVLPIIS